MRKTFFYYMGWLCILFAILAITSREPEAAAYILIFIGLLLIYVKPLYPNESEDLKAREKWDLLKKEWDQKNKTESDAIAMKVAEDTERIDKENRKKLRNKSIRRLIFLCILVYILWLIFKDIEINT